MFDEIRTPPWRMRPAMLPGRFHPKRCSSYRSALDATCNQRSLSMCYGGKFVDRRSQRHRDGPGDIETRSANGAPLGRGDVAGGPGDAGRLTRQGQSEAAALNSDGTPNTMMNGALRDQRHCSLRDRDSERSTMRESR